MIVRFFIASVLFAASTLFLLVAVVLLRDRPLALTWIALLGGVFGLTGWALIRWRTPLFTGYESLALSASFALMAGLSFGPAPEARAALSVALVFAWLCGQMGWKQLRRG